MQILHYNLFGNVNKQTVIALVADLHDHPYDEIINSLREKKPDYIVINGDLLYAAVPGYSIYTHVPESRQHFRNTYYAQGFLSEAIKIAPILFSTGNHELYLDKEDEAFLKDIGVYFLDNSFVVFDDLVFGGLSSPYKFLADTGNATTAKEHSERWKLIFSKVDTSWLEEFENQKGYTILLSHHPEFYDCFLRERKIDLILSGHAHGGQIRFFGIGLFAFGQGWFPHYTKGIYDRRLIVSSGLANTARIPRINNPLELLYINILPKNN